MTDLTPLDSPDDPSSRVLALPGVAALFPVHVVSHIRETIAAAVVVDPQPVNRIEVTTVSGITRIKARISADADKPVPATARAVADTLLQRTQNPDTTITVQVAHIA